jgi:hypothetical protein
VRYCAGLVKMTTELSNCLFLMLNETSGTARRHFVLAFGQELNISIECITT